MLFLHGGGWATEHVENYDRVCSRMAQATGQTVAAVEYRLAPEAAYPAALIDAQAALKFLPRLLASLDIAHKPVFSVAGDSCGAGLAAIVAARARLDKDVSVRRQVLITPVLDYSLSTPSMDRYGEGFFVEKSLLAWCLDQYLPGGQDRKALSPFFWEYGPGLAQTMIVTAEFSLARDEGAHFAEKLRQAGVHVELLHFDDMIHGFPLLENLVPDACRKLYEAVSMFLQG